MTTIAGPKPFVAPRGAAAPRAVAPAQSAPAPRPASAAEVLAWCDRVNPTVGQASAAGAQALVTRAQQQLATPGLDARTAARVRLVASAAHFQLAKLEVDRLSNGKAGFGQLRAAFDQAPGLDWAATGYGRAIAGLNAMPGYKRGLLTMGVGINAKKESARVLPALAAYPGDPYAQLTRLALARTLGDAATARAAEAAIAPMDPAMVAKVKAELARDAG